MIVRLDLFYKYLIDLLLIFIIIGCFGYVSSLYVYHATVKYMGVLLIYSLFMMYVFRKHIQKLPTVWLVTWLYISISTIFLNFPNSFRYLVVFSLGVVLLKLSTVSSRLFCNIPKLFIAIGVVFSLITLAQIVIPSLFDVILRIVQNEELYMQTLEYRERFGAYCGIAGESSFNAFCIALGILCLVSSLYVSRKRKYLKILFIGIMYYSILLTGKRSFLLMIPMIILSLFFMQSMIDKNKKNVTICIVLMFVLPLIFYSFLGNLVMDILASGKGRNYGAAVDLSNRELFWAIAFKMFKTSPIFGHGMMAYDNYYNDFFNHDYTFAGAHNSYFQLFAEMGFLGGVIYVYAIFISFFKTVVYTKHIMMVKKNNLKFLMYSSLCIQAMCIIYCWSGNPFHRPQQLLTYFVALGIGLYAYKLEKIKIK